jgi:nucleoside-diphosphate-sugar epimerase
MKAILVTGGAGFVGSHACKALVRAGYLPVCFDNLEKGHEWAVKWGPLERGDLRNEQDLRRVFEAWRPWGAKSANGPDRHHAEEALPDSAPALHRGPIPSKQALGVQCRQQLELD